MRKSNILIFLLMLLSSSCTAQTSNKDIINTKLKEKDFSYLKIQTVLAPEDQAYYKRVHNEIGEIGKHFAYRELDAIKKYCPVLNKMFDEISVRPISREREREINLLFRFCNENEKFSKIYKPITYEEYRYISTKITNSASIFSALANYEGNLMNRSKLNMKGKHKEIFEDYWRKTLIVDPLDLSYYLEQDSLKEEYCQKAVKLKQWDHIYYLTQGVDIASCLERGEINLGNKNKCCREAMVLAVKGWSKEDLYDHGRINYSADEMMPGVYEETKRDIRSCLKIKVRLSD